MSLCAVADLLLQFIRRLGNSCIRAGGIFVSAGSATHRDGADCSFTDLDQHTPLRIDRSGDGRRWRGLAGRRGRRRP